MSRPAVSVIMPFKGTAGDAEAALAALARIERGPGDELMIVDNSPEPVVPRAEGVEVLRAGRIGCSYYARNVGAAAAGNDWLLFLDSDTRPSRSLLNDYFALPLPEGCGIVAGEVDGAPEQQALTARHARSRRHLGVEANLWQHAWGPYPAAGTANLLVRRLAWEELGGFREVRSGADLELCWRAQANGWRFVVNPRARVEHLHMESLWPLLRKVASYGKGQAWSDRLYPQPKRPLLRQLLRSVAGVVVWTVGLRFERAAFKALDGTWTIAFAIGYRFGDNRPRPLPGAAAGEPEELANGA